MSAAKAHNSCAHLRNRCPRIACVRCPRMVLVPITDERGQEVLVSSKKARVEQLRNELERRGLNTSGRKAELVEKLSSLRAQTDIEDMQVVQTTDQQEMQVVLDAFSRLQSSYHALQDRNRDLQEQNQNYENAALGYVQDDLDYDRGLD